MQSNYHLFTWWGTRRKTTCGHGKLSWNYWHGYCRFITNFYRKASKKTAYQSFQTIILKALEEANIDFSINGEPTNRLAHVLNLHLKGIPSDLLLMHLDLRGIAISTGSACTAGTVDPSHVLTAMYGENSSAIKESIRISFGYGNTPEEIATFLKY